VKLEEREAGSARETAVVGPLRRRGARKLNQDSQPRANWKPGSAVL